MEQNEWINPISDCNPNQQTSRRDEIYIILREALEEVENTRDVLRDLGRALDRCFRLGKTD